MNQEKFRYLEGGGGEKRLTPEEVDQMEADAYVEELRDELKTQTADLVRLEEDPETNKDLIQQTEEIIAELEEQIRLSEGE